LKKFSWASEIQSGKENSFPILSDEYTYMKGSMTNTDQLGYQILRIIKYDSKTVSDVNMVPVSEFIDIKGLEFEKEDFIMNQKRIQGQM
jgi:putative ABC transport system permease protein